MTYRPLLRTPLRWHLCGLLGVATATFAVSASAQPQDANWDRPVVYDVRIGIAAPGERFQQMLGEEPIQIPAGGSIELEVQGIDQFGRAFPAERMLPQLEADRRCSGLISVEETGDGEFAVAAGSERGDCRLYLWIPGNLNLEWSLEVEVISATAQGYTHEQAELVVTRLYRGVLGRDPEPEGLQSQTAEVLRGRLEGVVRGMYQSREFLNERSRLSAMEQLEDLYRELLGREVDAEGIRSHLQAMEQRRYLDVALRIVRSQEFERFLLEAAAP